MSLLTSRELGEITSRFTQLIFSHNQHLIIVIQFSTTVNKGCVCVLVAQSCLTLCDRMDYSLPGSSVHGILQARILPFPSPGDLPDPGIEPKFPALQGRFFTV